MSRSILHDWECDIEKLGGDNANQLLDIAQDIYNTGYVRGKNQMTWVIEDIREEVEKQYKWLMRVAGSLHDIDIAFDAINASIDKHLGKE